MLPTSLMSFFLRKRIHLWGWSGNRVLLKWLPCRRWVPAPSTLFSLHPIWESELHIYIWSFILLLVRIPSLRLEKKGRRGDSLEGKAVASSPKTIFAYFVIHLFFSVYPQIALFVSVSVYWAKGRWGRRACRGLLTDCPPLHHLLLYSHPTVWCSQNYFIPT